MLVWIKIYFDNGTGVLNRPLIVTQNDIDNYFRLVRDADGIYLPFSKTKDSFELVRKFKFASKKQSILPWNFFPCDVCHDLIESPCFERILSLVLMSINNQFIKNKATMVNIISNKRYYETTFLVRSMCPVAFLSSAIWFN